MSFFLNGGFYKKMCALSLNGEVVLGGGLAHFQLCSLLFVIKLTLQLCNSFSSDDSCFQVLHTLAASRVSQLFTYR